MALRNFLQRKLLRRSHFSSGSYYSSYSFAQSNGSNHRQGRQHHFLLPSVQSSSALSSFARSKQFPVPFGVHSFSHSFSTRESTSVEGLPLQDCDFKATQSATPADLFLPGDVADAGTVVESILPVSTLISLLDGYHRLTGFPWWFIIASGTLAMRLTLFPFVVLQLRKLMRIGELLPKLPPPFPPPMSGRTIKDQFKLFYKEKRAAGCPSLFWFISSFSLQVPCFLLWLTAIRRMSFDHHNGFDCGGILWFQDLTEVPNGILGPILPLLIAGLHFVNVQVSFQRSSVMNMSGTLGSLAKYYKLYLEILALPMLFISFNLPQGSLVYWLVNSLLSLLQQISLRHPNIRKRLGLREVSTFFAKQKELDSSETVVMNTSRVSQKMIPAQNLREVSTFFAKQNELDSSETVVMNTSRVSQKMIPAQNLSPQELVNIATKFFAEGKKDVALQLLRLAIDKDPNYARALILMAQTQLENGFSSQATATLERCIDELLSNGPPTEIEDIDHLILSSEWAGVSCIRQGKYEEGIAHLERVALMEEPEDPKTRTHYYDALTLFSSALYVVGRRAEAAKYLRMICAYDPSCKELLEQCENDEDNVTEPLHASGGNKIVNDLDNNRRAD